MQFPPADVFLTWPTPNYDNPHTRGPALVIINGIFIVLVYITVGLRLYTRLYIKRWFGLDDVFILLALLFTTGLTAVVLLANQKYGWNRHIWDIPFGLLEPTAKIAMTAKIVFTAAATFTRLSLHWQVQWYRHPEYSLTPYSFYYRLVADTGTRWFKWLIHANVVYSVGILISYIFIAVFMCVPVRYYWTLGAPAGHCMDEAVATLICGIINCVADLATTITPLPLVVKLQMPRRQRIAVGILFSLGFIVTIAGVVRTWFIYKSLFNENFDQTWYVYPLWIAAAVEIDLGVICASAPVLRPLLKKIPYSLSETLSRLSSKKSSNQSSKGSSQPKSASVRKGPGPSFTSSSGKTGTLMSVPELNDDHWEGYELRQWDDLERASSNQAERGSEDAILEIPGQAPSSRSKRGIWGKAISSRDRSRTQDEMTITRTDEVEILSKRASREQKALNRTSFSRKPSA